MAKRTTITLATGVIAAAFGAGAHAERPDPRERAWGHCLEKLSANLDPRAIEVLRVTERGAETYKFYLSIKDAARTQTMDCTCTASARKGVLRAQAVEMRPVMAIAKAEG